MRRFVVGFLMAGPATFTIADKPCMPSPVQFDKNLLDGVIDQFKNDYRTELEAAQDGRRRRTSLIDYFVDPFVEPYCDQVKALIPVGDCTCEVHLLALEFAFSCDLSSCDSDACPKGVFNGTVDMLSMEVSSKVEYSVAGQTIGLTGNHCADDPQKWCSCAATLNGQSCQGG